MQTRGWYARGIYVGDNEKLLNRFAELQVFDCGVLYLFAFFFNNPEILINIIFTTIVLLGSYLLGDTIFNMVKDIMEERK